MGDPILMDECNKCKSKVYGYKHDPYTIYLCWTCGAYYIYPASRDKFIVTLMNNPLLLLDLIKENKVTRI